MIPDSRGVGKYKKNSHEKDYSLIHKDKKPLIKLIATSLLIYIDGDRKRGVDKITLSSDNCVNKWKKNI